MDRLIRKLRPRLLAWLRRSRPGRVLFLKHFPYKDIKRAADSFQWIMYTNSHIAAYKARFQDAGVVLVKEIRDYNQGKDVFYREVQLLGQLHHRHLLALKGFSTGHRRFLVFDNIERGSLKEHLNDPFRTPLNWRTRLQIAIGVVAGLEYLLLFNEPMYHVSISSSSIMLDENFNAKMSAFKALVKITSQYLIPHVQKVDLLYPSSLKVAIVSFIYPFLAECMGQECGNIMFQLGVLILELISGQSSENGGAALVQWIQESRLCSSIHKMLDPDLGNGYDSGELKSLLAVAKLCVKSENKPKASLLQILRYLHKKIETPRD